MDEKQFTVLDILNVLSFYLGVKNLNENLSQEKAGDMLSIAVDDIHKHLSEQDEKLKRIEEFLYDKNKKPI